MILLKVFYVFLKISFFAIGGAYSFLPIMEKEFIHNHSWMTREEFIDVVGISRVFPGAISVKFATYVGYKLAGVPGAIVANLGHILGPALMITFAMGFYAKYRDVPSVKGAFHYIGLVVFAMIIAVSFKMVNISELLHVKNILVVAVSFALFLYTKIHPALIILSAGLLGAFLR